MDDGDLVNRFTYHRPVNDMPEKFVQMRKAALELARLYNQHVPNGPEKETAIIKLEESNMWANAGLARTAPLEDGK